MRYSSGAPALLERNHVMLWLSTLDRDYSDLAIRPPFSPLMAQLARYLGGSLRSTPDEAVMSGRAVELSLPVGREQAWARRVDGGPAFALPAEALRFQQPGLYALYPSASARTAIAGTLFTVLSSLDESDFAPVSARDVAERWGAPNTSDVVETSSLARAASGDFTSYAHFLLVALVIFFSLQTLVARQG